MNSSQQEVANSQEEGAFDFIKRHLSGIPPATRLLCCVLIVFTILGLVVPLSETYFAINLGYMGSPFFRVWTLLTAPFYETSLFSSIIDVVCMVVLGKILEPIWGSNELVVFVAVVSLASSLISFAILCVLSFLIFPHNITLTFNANICGFIPSVIGFIVGLVQLAPDQEHTFIGVTVRTKHFPLITIGIALLLGVLFGFQTFLFCISGFISSWIYLRFFQRHPGGIIGDPLFQFSTFMPQIIRSWLSNNSAIISITSRFNRRRDHGRLNGINGIGLGSDVEALRGSKIDIERRRAVALRAIDLRLQQNDESSSTTTTAEAAKTTEPISQTLPTIQNPNDTRSEKQSF